MILTKKEHHKNIYIPTFMTIIIVMQQQFQIFMAFIFLSIQCLMLAKCVRPILFLEALYTTVVQHRHITTQLNIISNRQVCFYMPYSLFFLSFILTLRTKSILMFAITFLQRIFSSVTFTGTGKL